MAKGEFNDLINHFETAMRNLVLLFEDESFKYNPNDQTLEEYGKFGLHRNRGELVKAYLKILDHQLQGKTVK